MKYTCGECYTAFELPEDMRCPTCKIREIVPMQEEVELLAPKEGADKHG